MNLYTYVIKPPTPRKKSEADPAAPKQPELTDAQLAVAGWENLPLLTLKMVLEHPFVMDILKHDVLKWEFTQERKKYKEERYTAAMACVLGHLVRMAEYADSKSRKPDEEMYFAGWLG